MGGNIYFLNNFALKAKKPWWISSISRDTENQLHQISKFYFYSKKLLLQ